VLKEFCVTSYGKSKVEFGECMSELPKQIVLQEIFKVKASQAEDDISLFNDMVIEDFCLEQAPQIKKYKCLNSGEGYCWTMLVNNE
jgi:hypothetical protein